MTPDLRERIETSISGHEGLMLKVYDDATGRTANPGTLVKGWLTIGFGRNLVGRGITRAEAGYLLDNDLAAVELELDQHFPVWRQWAEPRQWAIFELGYNLGVYRLAREWPTTADHLRSMRFESVAAILSGSKWRSQVGDGRALPIIRAMHKGAWA
jgi:lysozyme